MEEGQCYRWLLRKGQMTIDALLLHISSYVPVDTLTYGSTAVSMTGDVRGLQIAIRDDALAPGHFCANFYVMQFLNQISIPTAEERTMQFSHQPKAYAILHKWI